MEVCGCVKEGAVTFSRSFTWSDPGKVHQSIGFWDERDILKQRWGRENFKVEEMNECEQAEIKGTDKEHGPGQLFHWLCERG